jgi:hypothetical protein
MTAKRLLDVFLRWIPVAVLVTCLSGLVYLVAQQSIRLGANGIPVQLAGDAAQALTQGTPAQAVVSATPIDLAVSDSPFVAVYSDAGQPVASSARLNGQPPAVPRGVFDYVRQHGEDRITWQPQPGVRSAVAVVRYDGPQPGFVVAGRSLREAERLIDLLTQLVGLAWAVTLVVTLVAMVGVDWLRAQLGLVGTRV